jgi:hypothetical protein
LLHGRQNKPRRHPERREGSHKRRLSTRVNLYIPNFECEARRYARDDDAFTLDVISPLGGEGDYQFRESLLFAQFRQNGKILERRRVAGYAFATGNFLE